MGREKSENTDIQKPTNTSLVLIPLKSLETTCFITKSRFCVLNLQLSRYFQFSYLIIWLGLENFWVFNAPPNERILGILINQTPPKTFILWKFGRMFWNIYSKSLDIMPFIISLLENKLKKEVTDNLSSYVLNLQFKDYINLSKTLAKITWERTRSVTVVPHCPTHYWHPHLLWMIME